MTRIKALLIATAISVGGFAGLGLATAHPAGAFFLLPNLGSLLDGPQGCDYAGCGGHCCDPDNGVVVQDTNVVRHLLGL